MISFVLFPQVSEQGMNFIIHHFLIDHNSPKFCITIVLDFSLDDCNTPEKLETMVMQNLGWGRGVGGGGEGALWSM